MKIFGLEFGRKLDLKNIPDAGLPGVRTCVYTLCYNEEIILPFFLRHYLSFCEEAVVYDNGSTDRSVSIVNSFKNARVVDYHAGELRDDLHMLMKNNIWKEARGRFDFVIVVDIDEFVYAPDMKKLLAWCKKTGKTALCTAGYNMVGERVPAGSGKITDAIKAGSYDRLYNKTVVFDPNRIREINYTVGAHRAVPRGRVRRFSSPDLKLLHYKYLSKQSYLDKIKNARQSEINRRNNWGFTLDYGQDYHSRLYDSMLEKAEKVL